MDIAASVEQSNASAGSDFDSVLRLFSRRQPWAYVASISLAVCLLIADGVLPRGATAAIGYCLVSVLAAGTRRRGFLLAMTVACTFLTCIGFFLEPRGSLAWMSVFDRAMVIGVLWLTFVLVTRRMQAVTVLARQTQALEEAKRDLQRSNVELGNFASVVAHDIRGPLNTIGLFAQLLGDRRSRESESEAADAIEKIQAEVASLSHLIQSLLAYARVGSGEVRRTDCDFERALESVRTKLRSALDGSRAEVTNDALPTLRADPVLIEQLFQNLIENSIKYRSEAPPRVHVAATQNSNDWQFVLRDNGIGIKPSDAAQVFKPFHQLHRTKSDRGGVGLGLATCKRIVERHGGRIELDLTRPQGTTFRFTIPIEPHTCSQASEESC